MSLTDHTPNTGNACSKYRKRAISSVRTRHPVRRHSFKSLTAVVSRRNGDPRGNPYFCPQASPFPSFVFPYSATVLAEGAHDVASAKGEGQRHLASFTISRGYEKDLGGCRRRARAVWRGLPSVWRTQPPGFLALAEQLPHLAFSFTSHFTPGETVRHGRSHEHAEHCSPSEVVHQNLPRGARTSVSLSYVVLFLTFVRCGIVAFLFRSSRRAVSHGRCKTGCRSHNH